MVRDETIYGYENSEREAGEVVELALSQGATGVYTDVGEDGAWWGQRYKLGDARLSSLASACHEAGLNFVLAFQLNPHSLDADKLKRALEVTRQLGLGDHRSGEWMGDYVGAGSYKDLAADYGFEWVCPLLHEVIAYDIPTGRHIRAQLGETFCISLSAYILAGYLYADPDIPHQGYYDNGMPTSALTGKNAHVEYGLTIQAVRDYLEPLNIISGVGFQDGLKAGTRVYLRQLGFKGIIGGLPFDLTGSLDVPVYGEPEEYPTTFGLFPGGYRCPKSSSSVTKTVAEV